MSILLKQELETLESSSETVTTLAFYRSEINGVKNTGTLIGSLLIFNSFYQTLKRVACNFSNTKSKNEFFQ